MRKDKIDDFIDRNRIGTIKKEFKFNDEDFMVNKSEKIEKKLNFNDYDVLEYGKSTINKVFEFDDKLFMPRSEEKIIKEFIFDDGQIMNKNSYIKPSIKKEFVFDDLKSIQNNGKINKVFEFDDNAIMQKCDGMICKIFEFNDSNITKKINYNFKHSESSYNDKYEAVTNEKSLETIKNSGNLFGRLWKKITKVFKIFGNENEVE